MHLVGNDAQNLINADQSIAALYSDASWDQEYQKRIKRFLSIFRKKNIDVVVLGMSNVRLGSFREKLEKNNILLQQSTLSQGFTFLSLWAITSNTKDAPLKSVNHNGIEYPLFLKDGIHLSLEGAKHVANYIHETLNVMYQWD